MSDAKDNTQELLEWQTAATKALSESQERLAAELVSTRTQLAEAHEALAQLVYMCRLNCTRDSFCARCGYAISKLPEGYTL